MQKLVTRAAIVLFVGLAAVGLTACNKYGLTGHVDSFSQSGQDVTITGWLNAADPKAPRDGWQMVVFVDGVHTKTGASAFSERPDVVAAVGPNSWGFKVTGLGVATGWHEICVDAVPVKDAPTATSASSIACSTVYVADSTPKANVDSVTLEGPDVRIQGWVYAPSFEAGGARLPALFIDEDVYEGDFVAGSRPDVTANFYADPQTVWGLDELGPLDPGEHEICLGVIDAEGLVAEELSCVDVVVPV